MALLVNNFDWKIYMCKRHLGACTKDNSQKWHLCHLQAKWSLNLAKLYWVVFKTTTEGSEVCSFLECELTENMTESQLCSNQSKTNLTFKNISPLKWLLQLYKKLDTFTYIDSGYWWVSKANMAVNEQSPAVNRMKNGNSFLG